MLKLPPVLRSFVARGACQSGEAKVHFVMCNGLVQQSQIVARRAATTVSTVILFADIRSSLPDGDDPAEDNVGCEVQDVVYN